MCADLGNYYRAEVLEMARAGRKAAEGWRYRHHRGAASRMLSAAWAGLKGLAGKAVRIDKPDVAPARQRLSY
jgi:hypothetical protein